MKFMFIRQPQHQNLYCSTRVSTEIPQLWRTAASSCEDAYHARNIAIIQENKIQLHSSFVPPTHPVVIGHFCKGHTVSLQTAEHCLYGRKRSKTKPLLKSASDQIFKAATYNCKVLRLYFCFVLRKNRLSMYFLL